MSNKLPRSKMVLRNTNLLSTGFGRLTPFFFAEVNPNERLSQVCKFNVQLTPMLAPAFQDCRLYVHWYFVPSRILHLNEEYNAWVSREQRKLATMSNVPISRTVVSLGDLISAVNHVYRDNTPGSVVPYVTDQGAFFNMLPDYLRLQLSSVSDYTGCKESLIAEPFVAMFKLFLDHYCSTLYKTYFINSTDMYGSYTYLSLTYEDLLWLYSWFQKYGFDYVFDDTQSVTVPSGLTVFPLRILVQIPHVMYGRKGDMFMEAYPVADYVADSTPVGADIEALRLNSAMARYKERKARVGKGVAEFFWEFFHIKASDNRLQTSSFLGGGRSDINIDDVPQTSENTSNSALGQLAGNGWKKTSFGFGRRYFEDYGYVFGVLYLLPKQAYYNGIDQLFKHAKADDLYLEAFDSLGDEPVFKRELCTQYSTTDNDTVIGYQPRYQRYKRVKNEIHGDFCGSLNYYHQSRNLPITADLQNIRPAFAGPQGLNRVFNYNGVLSEAQPQPIWVYVKIKSKWRRPMRYDPKPRIQ